MKSIKGSHVLATLGWAGCFFTLVCILFKKLPFDGSTIFTFIFFFVIAVFASAVAQGSNKPKLKDGSAMRVKIAGQIFTGDSLTILQLKSGDLFVEVDLTDPQKEADKRKKFKDGDGPIETTKHPQKVNRG